jgi:hypothetical protein
MSKVQKEYLAQEIQPQKIIIFLTFPNILAKRVKVFSSDPIDILFQFLPSGKKIVFYQGEIIQSYDSFQNYDISDYDRIAIINEDQMSFQTEQFWKTATLKDYENKIILKASQDPTIEREISRQQDLVFTRIENHQRCFLNTIKNFRFLTDESRTNEYSTCLDWEKKEKPNGKSLPKLW